MSKIRDFKGIWIPREIWLHDNLTIKEKLFYVEIDSLDNENGCFASNAHFSKMFGLSKNRCTEIIKSLESKGLIALKLVKKGNRITSRIIKCIPIRKTEHPYSENRDTPIRKTEHPYSENRDTPIRKTEHPYSENRDGNNTSINNTKRETRAADFLKNNFPSRYEQEFSMRYSSKIRDLDKFIEDYNDTVDIEELIFSPSVLFGRLSKYSKNWIQNQDKYSPIKNNLKPQYTSNGI
jgi:hypothetical protein